MSTTVHNYPAVPAVADVEIELRRSFWHATLHFCRREPLGAFGMLIVLIMAVTGFSAELIAPYSPTANDFASMTEAPSWAHWLGTDQFGRDLLSRIIYGARTALIVGLTSAIVGGFAGLVLGVASAYFGGKLDLVFQRIFDVVMAFPLIIMALAVVSIFGTGVHNVIVAITIPLIPRCARVVRSSALAIREIPYVDAARACGFGHARIILRHMVPNVMAPFLIMLTAFVGQGIAVLPRPWRARTDAGVGFDAARGRGGVRIHRPMDRDLPRSGNCSDRVRRQPVRRRAARRAGPEDARAVRHHARYGTD